MEQNYFSRTSVAQKLTDNLLSNAGSSGLFLSAPRRTGKSKFLIHDVIPLLEDRGALVIYSDLWSDRSKDPSEMIASAVQAKILEQQNLFQRSVRSVTKVSIPFLGSIDVSQVGIGKNVSLAEALGALSKETQEMIVLIIDEAQHANTTENGINTMFALKSARDMLNTNDQHGFRLLATGSSQSRLSNMVNGKDQAFLNGWLMELPFLGADYLQWALGHYPTIPAMPDNVLAEVFSKLKHSPEYLERSLAELAGQTPQSTEQACASLGEIADRVISSNNESYFAQLSSLPPSQLAVLYVLCSVAPFAAFSIDSMREYKRVFSQLSEDDFSFNSSNVQSILESLKDKEMIWKSSRGVYAIDEQQNADLVLQYVEQLMVHSKTNKHEDASSGPFADADNDLVKLAVYCINLESNIERLSQVNERLLTEITARYHQDDIESSYFKRLVHLSNCIEGKIIKFGFTPGMV